MLDSLEGKIALVTGSSRGIGRSIALALAREGADVAVNYRARADAARDVTETIATMGRRSIAVKADVGEPEECAALVDATLEGLGAVDILVNNAGIWRGSIVEEVKPETLESLVATNVKGAFFITGRVVKHMKEAGWGRIINVSSVIGVRGYPGDSMYGATKAALFGFTKSLARELARFDVTVNAVVPGFIETDMAVETGDETRERILKTIPIRRWGTPEEVAELVVFLAEKGDYMTGGLYAVDGGYTI